MYYPYIHHMFTINQPSSTIHLLPKSSTRIQVLSSSWNGHWAMAGWASRLLELNGSALELRCERDCGASWASEERPS